MTSRACASLMALLAAWVGSAYAEDICTVARRGRDSPAALARCLGGSAAIHGECPPFPYDPADAPPFVRDVAQYVVRLGLDGADYSPLDLNILGRTPGLCPKQILADLTPGGFCTGLIIAPDVVVTAAHCLYDAQENLLPAESITVESDESTGFPIRTTVGVSYLSLPAAGSRVADRDDVAILRLEKDAFPEGLFASIESVAPSALGPLDATGFSMGYPLGTGLRFTVPGSITASEFSATGLYGAEISVLKGNSGSPVFRLDEEDSPHLVGMVRGGPPLYDGIGCYCHRAAAEGEQEEVVPLSRILAALSEA